MRERERDLAHSHILSISLSLCLSLCLFGLSGDVTWRRIPFEDLDFSADGGVVGRGKFGQVFVARMKSTGERVALKHIVNVDNDALVEAELKFRSFLVFQ